MSFEEIRVKLTSPHDVLGLAVEPEICEQAGPACDPGPGQKCHKSEIVRGAQLNYPTLTRQPRKFSAEKLATHLRAKGAECNFTS